MRSAIFRTAGGRFPGAALAALVLLLASVSGGSGDIWRRDAAKGKSGDVCRELAMAADDRSPFTIISSELEKYRQTCEGERLRGCLLPREEYNTTLEEYLYRKRHCPVASDDCAALRERIAGLQQERQALQAVKNQQCRLVREQPAPAAYGVCQYEIRRIAAVIDAAAVNEIWFEENCF